MKKFLLTLIITIAFFNFKNSYAQITFTLNCQISPFTSGLIVVYKKQISTINSKMNGIDTVMASAATFSTVVNAPDTGRYIFKFIPSVPLYQSSYADTTENWITAKEYNLGLISTTFSVLFMPTTYASVGSGSYSLSGTITEGDGYGQKSPLGVNVPGNPIGGIIVKGGKNPGGQYFAQTTTDANGNYSFNNLPSGDYFLFVEIPGLDTINPWYVTLNNNSVNNLNWVADSMKVTGGGALLQSVNELEKEKFDVKVFPNPTSSNLYFSFVLPTANRVEVELYDVLSRKIKTICPSVFLNAGMYKKDFSTSDINSGVYFLKIKIGDKESTSKITIQR